MYINSKGDIEMSMSNYKSGCCTAEVELGATGLLCRRCGARLSKWDLKDMYLYKPSYIYDPKKQRISKVRRIFTPRTRSVIRAVCLAVIAAALYVTYFR